MAYAENQTIHDADSHVMELPGTLEKYLESRYLAAFEAENRISRQEAAWARDAQAQHDDPEFRAGEEAGLMQRKNYQALGSFRSVDRVRALDLLQERQEIRARNVTVPEMKGLREWVKRETKLGNPALEAEAKKTQDADLILALNWSTDVNDSVKKIVRDVPPFPYVRESLEKLKGKADAIVVSQTPTEALVREWREHTIDSYVGIIAGQELGTKTEHIAFAAKGKYPQEKMLMIGDAPGDYKAAKANSALFFPVNPGHEEESWQRFHDEGLDRFFGGSYAGEYEDKLVAEFNKYMPEKAPWQS